MRSTGKLLSLIAVFVAFGLVTTTGAFTTVEAQRTATVDVAGDSGALLGLENGSSGLIQSPNGEIEITLDGSSAGGVNANAVTSVNESKFLNITNNGNKNGVEINMSYDTATSVSVYFVVSSGDLDGQTSSDLSSELSSSLFDPSTKYSISDPDNTVKLDPGETVSVGIIIDTTGASPGTQIINGDITITADA
jgi:hypothetical protein